MQQAGNLARARELIRQVRLDNGTAELSRRSRMRQLRQMVYGDVLLESLSDAALLRACAPRVVVDDVPVFYGGGYGVGQVDRKIEKHFEDGSEFGSEI